MVIYSSRAQPVWMRLRMIHNWSEVLHRSIPTVWRRHPGPHVRGVSLLLRPTPPCPMSLHTPLLYPVLPTLYLSDRGIYPRPSTIVVCKLLRDRLILLLVTPSAAGRGGHVMVSRSSGPETVSRALKRLQKVHILESFLRPSTCPCRQTSDRSKSPRLSCADCR